MPPPQADPKQQALRNAAITALAAQQLSSMWPNINWDAGADTLAAVTALYRSIVTQFGQASASIAAEHYDDLRDLRRLTSKYRAVPADPAPAEQITRIVESAFLGHDTTTHDEPRDRPANGHDEPSAGSKFDELHREAPPPAQTTSGLILSERVQTRLDDSLSRLVLQPGRDTIAAAILNDPAKPTWIRVPKGPDTCEFCILLASRELGPNFSGYASAHNALFREDGERYHKKCDCVALPVFPGQDAHDISPHMADYQDLYERSAERAGTRRDLKAVLAAMRQVRKKDRDNNEDPPQQDSHGPVDLDTPPPGSVGRRSGTGEDDDDRISADAWQHIMARHGPGTSEPKASRFPDRWSEADIRAAVRRTLADPYTTSDDHEHLVSPDFLNYYGYIDGVRMSVRTRKTDGTVATANPLDGDGVTRTAKKAGAPRTVLPLGTVRGIPLPHDERR